MFKTKKRKIITTILASMLIIIVSILGYSYYQYNQMLNKLVVNEEAETHHVMDQTKDEEEIAKRTLKPMTVMVLGVDSRGEEQSRSDTIMLSVIHPQKESALLLSIPRDTYTFVKDVGYTKFNHSMFYGGPPLVKETISDFLDIEVDRYVTIDFEGFRKIVDEVGGIDINVDRRMKYTDPSDGTKIDLYPGYQVLDGEEALGFARFRLSHEGEPSSDYDRMKRQHEVIKAIMDKGNNFASVLKIFSIMDIVGDHIKTDFSKNEIKGLIKVFHDFSPEDLETIDIEGQGARKMAEGYNLWVYVVTDEERERVKENIQHFLETGELLQENTTKEESEAGS